MRLLLDTHVFLWWAADDPQLGNGARNAIASPDSYVAVSAVVAWELGIKRALKKLDAPLDPCEQIDRHSFEELPITIAHAVRAASLPRLHHDPFDRLLIAQAQLENLSIVTRDSKIIRYDVSTLVA